MLDPVAQLFQRCWGEGGALHKVSLEFTTFYGLRSSHDAVQVPALLEVVASVAHHYQNGRNNSQHGWTVDHNRGLLR